MVVVIKFFYAQIFSFACRYTFVNPEHVGYPMVCAFVQVCAQATHHTPVHVSPWVKPVHKYVFVVLKCYVV